MNEVADIRRKECEEKLKDSNRSTDRLDVAIDFLKFVVGIGTAITVVRLPSLY